MSALKQSLLLTVMEMWCNLRVNSSGFLDYKFNHQGDGRGINLALNPVYAELAFHLATTVELIWLQSPCGP